MVVRRNQQRSIYEEIAKAALPDCDQESWPAWMKIVDSLLDDDELVDLVHEALIKRRPKSASRGRNSTPSEVVLRLMVLKHIKNWTYQDLEQEVRPNFMYREFTRIGAGKVPDEKTMVRAGQALGSEVLEKVNEVLVGKAIANKIVKGRKMRTDTTVVETNIHYPTDSQLLADAVRVMTRLAKRIQEVVGETEDKFRDRVRSVAHRLIELGKSALQRGEQVKEKRKEIYRELMRTTRRVMTESQGVVEKAVRRAKRTRNKVRRAAIERLAIQLSDIIAVSERVMRQTRARVMLGNTHYEGKLVSIFERETETIRKGKAAKPTEFGKMVKIQEAENQIISHYEVFDKRPADQELLTPSIAKHKQIFGRAPELVAADAGFHSRNNEKEAAELGVKKLAVPGRRGRVAGKKKTVRPRWFRQAQRWRVGCEGRISVLKRRSGLSRSRYRGREGIRRWVGLGVIADNLLTMGTLLGSKK
jgi:transposase, IS5 family